MDQRRQTAGRREVWFLFQNMSEGSWSVEALELLSQLKVRSLGGVDLEDAAWLVRGQYCRDDEVAFPAFSRLVAEFTRRRLKRRVLGVLRDMWKCGRRRGEAGGVKTLGRVRFDGLAGPTSAVFGDSRPYLREIEESRERGAEEKKMMMKTDECRVLTGSGTPVGHDGHGPAPRCGSVPFVSGDSGPHLQETEGEIRDVLLTEEYVTKIMMMSEDTRVVGERRRSRCGRAGRPRHAWRKHGRRGKTVKRKRRGGTERAEVRRRHGRLRKLWKTRGLRQKRRNDKRPRGFGARGRAQEALGRHGEVVHFWGRAWALTKRLLTG
jgi:hypothetical protein